MNEKIKIAYLVIAYTDPEQLKSLVERLTQDADVYIHINASVEIEPFLKVLEKNSKPHSFRFSRERYKIVWGGFSILKATFSLMEQAMENDSYDRFVLLTGLDYPIKSDDTIQRFFQKYADMEFIHAAPVTGEMHEHLYYRDCRDNRALHWWFGQYNRILKKLGKKGKKDFVVCGGERILLYGIAPKWALSGKCATWLLQFYKNNTKFNRYFQLMHAPDDFYVATAVYHSPFREKIEAERDIFKIIWLPEDRGAKVLEEEDLDELVLCDQLYAKKFQSDSSEGLRQILEGHFSKEVQGVEE